MKYFLNLYQGIEKDMKFYLNKIKEDKDIDQFIFTGHSLGGAIASIALFDVMQEKLLPRTENSPALFTFGQPRTGNYAFANELMKEVPIVFRITNNFDSVVTVPTCEVEGKRCITEFKKYELDGNFSGYKELYDKFSSKEKKNFYPFHIGGLILIKGDDEILDCREKSEPATNDKCKGEFSLESGYHKYYFGYIVSKIGKPEDFPYGKEGEYSIENVVQKLNIWKEFASNKVIGFFSNMFKSMNGLLFHF